MSDEMVLTDVRGEGALKAGVINLNRPAHLNVLNDRLMTELGEALEAAARICQYSLPSLMLAKEWVKRAFEMPFAQGVLFERNAFRSLFGTHDQHEGMSAFLDKRNPQFEHA